MAPKNSHRSRVFESWKWKYVWLRTSKKKKEEKKKNPPRGTPRFSASKLLLNLIPKILQQRHLDPLATASLHKNAVLLKPISCLVRIWEFVFCEWDSLRYVTHLFTFFAHFFCLNLFMANFVRIYYIRAKKHNGKALVGMEPRTFTIIKHIR